VVVSTRIRDLRLKYGIPLRELSERAGISVQQLSRLELGTVAVTAHQEQRLRTALMCLVTDRRAALDALETELRQYSGLLLQPTEVLQDDS
jgi:transcriptional regulator with XRE-family HTH domain